SREAEGAGRASTLRAHLLEDFIGVAPLAARVRLVDPPRVLRRRALERARVATLRFFRFLVAEKRADVERFLAGGHALPSCAVDAGLRAGQERQKSHRQRAGQGFSLSRMTQLTNVSAVGQSALRYRFVIAAPIGVPGCSCQASHVYISTLRTSISR